MPYPAFYEYHQRLQADVGTLCEANMEIPDIEPERLARVQEIRQAVSERL